ncbi:MAG: DUF4440 domain-containing protein [Dehalococcoidia bacterium]|nr:DUF4440 domain-containing protein [Dehalococcoidia bacterium]
MLSNLTELEVVRAWHDALNERDLDRLLELSDEDVEVIGPRGAGRGRELLSDWAFRAGVSLSFGRMFHRGDRIVVEEFAQWRSSETGDVVGTANVASVFEVRGGKITRVHRFDDLDSALNDAELDVMDEVTA